MAATEPKAASGELMSKIPIVQRGEIVTIAVVPAGVPPRLPAPVGPIRPGSMPQPAGV